MSKPHTGTAQQERHHHEHDRSIQFHVITSFMPLILGNINHVKRRVALSEGLEPPCIH
jgi:hypothetical protein